MSTNTSGHPEAMSPGITSSLILVWPIWPFQRFRQAITVSLTIKSPVLHHLSWNLLMPVVLSWLVEVGVIPVWRRLCLNLSCRLTWGATSYAIRRKFPRQPHNLVCLIRLLIHKEPLLL